jgi:16S rRNA (adenine1518-N6/adenine1519-N6)-dimethyltransferase
LIRAKKSLGQNFLVDRRVASRIVEAVAPKPSDAVIEIGAGTGALTRRLVAESGYVVAVEIDRALSEGLRASVKSDNFALIEMDALEMDWKGLAATALGELENRTTPGHLAERTAQRRVRVVANLPYYISTAIIERLLYARAEFSDLTLMLQEEVVDRITSPPGERDYGYLSILIQYHAEAFKLFMVAPEAFNPVPKVRSAVVRLIVRERPLVEIRDEKRFFSLVRASFSQRRKTILNNLKSASLEFHSTPERALEMSAIDSRRRAETLSLEEFAKLFSALET